MDKVTRKKAQIIQRITGYLIENGMADVGLRKLAEIAGTSDRMLIYYFETKDELIGQVLHGVAVGLAAQLDLLLGEQVRPAELLFDELLRLGKTPQFRPVIMLWFEVVGLAVRGREPYATTANEIAVRWLAWMESRIEDPDPERVYELLAALEGMFMLELIGLARSSAV